MSTKAEVKLKTTLDSIGASVSVGDTIKVLEIDERIINFLPEDEVQELNSFINETFKVNSINSDGSMVVSKSWTQEEFGITSGHDLAIFPKGSLLINET